MFELFFTKRMSCSHRVTQDMKILRYFAYKNSSITSDTSDCVIPAVFPKNKSLINHIKLEMKIHCTPHIIQKQTKEESVKHCIYSLHHE